MSVLQPPSFGPQLGDGAVRFRLWAPGASKVELILNPEDPRPQTLPLEPAGDGFFEITAAAQPGSRYRFRRDGGPALPDPAGHFQPEGVHGASEIVALDYPWTDEAWRGRPPEELVIYELHVGTFSAEGSYRSVGDRLAYLADLGVTAVELMPLAAFPGRWGWGYDGTFHFAPFCGYGRPAELQRLIDACHAQGLAVILDVVTNHFGPEGNAMWTLAPDFFRPDRPTHWSSGINWTAEPVLRYFDELCAFWLRHYHVDGIRYDAFHAIPAGPRHLHLRRMLQALAAELPADRRFTALLESVDNQTSLLQGPDPRLHVCQLNFDFHRSMHALLTGEHHGPYRDHPQPGEDLGACLEQGFAYRDRYSDYHRRVRGESAAPGSWDAVVNFQQNHDTIGNRFQGQRLDQLTDPERLAAATALLLLHPALPFLFMGQEWRAGTPYYFFVDFPPGQTEAICAGRALGFTELDPQLPSPSAPRCDEIEAFTRSMLDWSELEQPAHRQALERTRQLCALRRQLLPRMSRRREDLQLSCQGMAYLLRIDPRRAGDPPLLLAANLGDTAVAHPEARRVLYSSGLQAAEQTAPRTTQLLEL